jgi:hypothetical protein
MPVTVQGNSKASPGPKKNGYFVLVSSSNV